MAEADEFEPGLDVRDAPGDGRFGKKSKKQFKVHAINYKVAIVRESQL